MSKNLSIRQFEGSFRAETSDSGNFLEGYAAVFNQRSKPIMENGKLFYEVIDPRAFDEVLATNPDVKLNYNHSRDALIARTKSGTLELSTDEKGLRFKANMPNTTLGNDLYVLCSRGDIFECSFAFYCRKGDDVWTVDNEGNNIRTILRISRLVDVSLVGDGAYANTTIATRQDENRTTITITICDEGPEEDPTETPSPTGDAPSEDELPMDSSTGMETDACKDEDKNKRELEMMSRHVHVLKLKN